MSALYTIRNRDTDCEVASYATKREATAHLDRFPRDYIAASREYRVHVTKRHPAWDERDGWDYHVNAASKADAVAIARRRYAYDGHLGLAWFKATELLQPEGRAS